MTVSKPPITYIGTNHQNLWAGKGQHKLAVVEHIAEGSLVGVDSWFSNAQAQASANYCVGRDGTIHCYVDPFGPDAPFANGIVNQPSPAVQALRSINGANPNYWTVSIEHEGMYSAAGTLLTLAQLEASAQLTAWLCEQFGIVSDENHILGHYEFDAVTRANCPGLNRAGWVAFEAAIAADQLPPPVPPTPLDPELAQLAAMQAILTALVARHTLKALPALQDNFHAHPGDPGDE